MSHLPFRFFAMFHVTSLPSPVALRSNFWCRSEQASKSLNSSGGFPMENPACLQAIPSPRLKNMKGTGGTRDSQSKKQKSMDDFNIFQCEIHCDVASFSQRVIKSSNRLVGFALEFHELTHPTKTDSSPVCEREKKKRSKWWMMAF